MRPASLLCAFFVASLLVTGCEEPSGSSREDPIITTKCQNTTAGASSSTEQTTRPDYVPSNYTLAWSDEFSTGTCIDEDNWQYEIGSRILGGTVWGNSERQYYTDSVDNVRVEGGALIIQAKHGVHENAPSGHNIVATSARIITTTDNYYNAIGNEPYGYYEVRAKTSCTNGSWPAIWLLGVRSPSNRTINWPHTGEIDIMEWSRLYNSANTFSSAVHTGAGSGGNAESAKLNYSGLCNQFHNFQLHWQEDSITTSINQTPVFTYNRPANWSSSNWPFTQPAYMIFNIAVGGNLGGDVNTSDIQNMRMEIDYVKVWQAAE